MAASSDNRKTLLRGGLIIDGTGGPPRSGSVLLEGARIAAVGDLPDDAGTAIDCTGKVIAPGFIDAHSHMDFFSTSSDPIPSARAGAVRTTRGAGEVLLS